MSLLLIILLVILILGGGGYGYSAEWGRTQFGGLLGLILIIFLILLLTGHLGNVKL